MSVDAVTETIPFGLTSGAVEVVEAALAGPADFSIHLELMAGYEAAASLVDLTRFATVLDAACVGLTGRVKSSRVWADEGFRSLPTWLARELRCDVSKARRDAAAADRLAELGEFADAYAAGDISRAHLNVMLSYGFKNSARRDSLPEFLSIFTELAKEAGPRELTRALIAWSDGVDPDGTEEDEEKARDREYLNFHQAGSSWLLEGSFTCEHGALIAEALYAALSVRFRAEDRDTPPVADGGDTVTEDCFGNPSTAAHDLLIASSREDKAQALLDIAAVYLNGPVATEAGGQRPTVTVTVPLERLATEVPYVPQAEPEGACPGGILLPFLGGVARLSLSNGPGEFTISSEYARMLSCDANVQRLMIDPDTMAMSLGRSVRTFTPAQRRALAVRDGGCVYPGCHKPPGWCHAHHVIHWAMGGKSELSNAALLCSKHHHEVHSRGHAINIGESGRARVALNYPRRRSHRGTRL